MWQLKRAITNEYEIALAWQSNCWVCMESGTDSTPYQCDDCVPDDCTTTIAEIIEAWARSSPWGGCRGHPWPGGARGCDGATWARPPMARAVQVVHGPATPSGGSWECWGPATRWRARQRQRTPPTCRGVLTTLRHGTFMRCHLLFITWDW